MENPFSFDMEQTNPVETLTSLVGQWQLPETPSLNRVYQEDGFELYLVDIGDGVLQLHADIKGKIPLSRIKHIEHVFITLIAALADRGMTEVTTWVGMDDEKSHRFCEFFGFEDTEFFKILVYEDGTERLMQEMVYTFPLFYDDEE